MNNHSLSKRGRGRPRTFDLHPEIKERLISIIRAGNYIDTAMGALGLSADFYSRAVDYANAGHPSYIELMRDLKKAECEAEIEAAEKMRTVTNWIPHATYLERRHRDKWGRSEKRQVEASVNITIASVNYNQLLKQMKK